MTKDEALKMAIETLELAQIDANIEFNCGNIYEKEINACKEALEQPTQETMLDTASYLLGRFDAHPHQWQGLTDDEMAEIIGHTVEFCHESGIMGEARAIEQALKEKNENNT